MPKTVNADDLLRQIETLKRQLAEAHKAARVAQKHVRDSYIGAAMSGLAVRWDWDHTSAQRLVEQAERLANAAMRQRESWERGHSVNHV